MTSLVADINNIDVSIVVPCYQEEPHLRESVSKIYELLNQTQYKFEVIFVDDCSKDKTRDVILSIVNEFPNSKYLFHEKNIGRGGTFIDRFFKILRCSKKSPCKARTPIVVFFTILFLRAVVLQASCGHLNLASQHLVL